ncbi:unnamed protein product [Paramecium primaurelia]|uniref:Transmembrane protein n=1 Tax=Paramecium primaurelia TaxID=5886 RepID=A0A8S1LVD3_PARPR|nr:unnamed protein product [Paramecium primaurelia]
MIFFFLTLLSCGSSIIVDANQRCACSEILLQEDCNTIMNCKWVNQKCQDYIYECQVEGQADIRSYICNWNNDLNRYEAQKFECSQFKNLYDCSRLKPHCFWNSTEMCNDFTSCQDYNEQYCPIYNKNCSIQDKICIDGIQQCENYKSEQTCRGIQSGEQECLWSNDNQCKGQSLIDCTSLTGFKVCDVNLIECKKNASGNCESLTCSDKKQENDCTNARIVKHGEQIFYLCVWQNGQCYEAINAKHLNRETCSKQTAANYKWVNNNCQACQTLQPKILDRQLDGYVEYETQIVIMYLSTFILSNIAFFILCIE